MTESNDYQRIEKIILYLDERRAEQPGLDELAGLVGLSSSHFHRLFTTWAGITPKDFLQILTFADVRRRLKEGQSVLEAALDAGLSGPGRLHDLTVSLEAATPGDIKSGGEGWTLQAGFADTPFGRALIAQSPRGISHLSFIEPGQESSELAKLKKDWPKARHERSDAAAARLAGEIFQRPGSGARRNMKAFVKGTAFQVRVWRALLAIPASSVVTYGRLAAAMGQPTASRAVGAAIGQNSLAYLIPCHRVIRGTGVIGDYRWGSPRKKAMLAWEDPVKALVENRRSYL